MQKKILYKGVQFDYYFCYNINGDDVKKSKNKKIDTVGTTICPWCARKYGLYRETGRSAKSLDREIALYQGEDMTTYNEVVCGVDGCWNGIAYDMYLDYSDVKMVNCA